MSSEFAPIIMVAIIWLVVGIPVIIAKRAAGQKTPVRRNPAHAPAETRPAAQEPSPERMAPLAPSISLTGHDDSIYRGSLNAVTGEGCDPCHDEQMAELTLAETDEPVSAPAPAHSGIPLGWTNNDVVRGIVMSEILTRKKH